MYESFLNSCSKPDMRQLFAVCYDAIHIFQDDNATRDLNDQLDALKAHLDYVQDNITEAQTEIADLEVGGNTTFKFYILQVV